VVKVDYLIYIDELNFDEIITFNHSYRKYHLFDGFLTSTKIEEFPFLMNHEFLLAGNQNFDEKSFSSMNNKEILQLIKSRVQNYLSEGDINFKMLFIESIPNYAKEIGFESTVDLILPIVAKIPEEKDNVKIKFLQNLKKFVEYLVENGEEGYKISRDQIIPILNEIFQDKKNIRVIELCSEALVEITKYIKDEDKGFHILTIVIVMAHDDQDEESRVLSAKLFNQLAPIIGRELCELYVVPQIASFADDPHSKVRKAVAGNFLNMCTSVSESSFKSKLLLVYQKLSKDSLWIVRKAAAEILTKITSLCDSETVSTALLDIFRSFTSDNQRYVRIAAIEVIGQFISLLRKEDLSGSILEFYIGIVDEYYGNKDMNSNETDVIFS
jgi:rRNA pseudouridine-1189 N-methylase Emg1 (Nep1/Mra1 family)